MRLTKILELRLKILAVCTLVVLFPIALKAQDKGVISLLEFRYGFQFPLQDMKERFGANNSIGVGFEVVRLRNLFFAGADGMLLFGSNVKEDVVAGLRGYDGNIIGLNGSIGNVNLKERGFYIGLNAGKIIPTGKHENNVTGVRLQVGGGLLQHKIRVQDNSGSVVALERDKVKGFDRLSNGPAVHIGLGFQYQNPKNNFHFLVMSDLYGALTRSRRDFDFLEGRYLDERRTDILLGIHLAYIVSISRSKNADQIYY